MNFTPRERNILNTGMFHDVVREARNALNASVQHVFLTLPTFVGRILFLGIEESFRTRPEALEILRWKLKKHFPINSADMHLDYQCLAIKANGSQNVLVALVSRPVIEQYEDAFAAVGILPARIELDCFSLHRLHANSLSRQGDFVLITQSLTDIGMIFFSEGIPEFIRTRNFSNGAKINEAIHKEVKCTVLAYRERFRKEIIPAVFCVAPAGAAQSLCNVVRDILEQEPVLLETGSAIKLGDSMPVEQHVHFPLSAAIGAAYRGF